MNRAIVGDRGQIILPEEIRSHLKLAEGSQVEFAIDENGEVKLIPLTIPVERLSGILHRPGMPAATLEEMEASILEGVRLMNAEESNDWT